MPDHYGDKDDREGFLGGEGLLRSNPVWTDRNFVWSVRRGQTDKQQGVLGMQPVREKV